MEPESQLARAIELERQGAIDESLEIARAEVERCRREGAWSMLADALHFVAYVLDWHRSRYDEARRAYAAEIEARSVHGLAGLDAAHLGHATICSFLQDDAAALASARQVRALSTDPHCRAVAANLMGDVLMASDPEEAERCLRQAEQDLEGVAADYTWIHLRLSLALSLAHRGDPKAALAAGEEQLEASLRLAEPGLVGTAHLRLAEIHRLDGDRERCVAHARRAEAIGEAEGWEVMCREASQILASVEPA